MAKATIHIERLRVYAYHGVGSQETRVGNVFEVDAVLEMPCPAAVVTDNIADTVSYAEVVEIIKAEMSKASQLLEHVVGRIKKALLSAYPEISGGRITVWKVCPPIPAELSRAGFSLEW